MDKETATDVGITMHEAMQVDEQYVCEEEGTGEAVMVAAEEEMEMDEAAKGEASHLMPPFRTTTAWCHKGYEQL